MSSTALVPDPKEHDSAFESFLERVIPYEKVGAVIPHDLLQFGLYGSVIVIVTGILALILPGSEVIRHSSFYLVLGSAVASLDTFMGALASWAIIFGGVLLILDAFLMTVRTSKRWRAAVVIQAAAGGVGGGVATIFLALVVLNLAIWIAICVLALVMIGLLLGAMAGG